MDPGRPQAKVVAVCRERIVSIGDSLDDLKPWASAVPTQIDRRVEDRIVFPGFIDAHRHPLLGALSGTLPPLS